MAAKEEKRAIIKDEYVAEYYPDILSNYSNSSGTISYDTIITPRRFEEREIRYATEGTAANDRPYYAHEIELLPAPVKPEPVEWDLLKRLNKLLEHKEKNKKTLEVQRAEKGSLEQSKKVIEQALLRFLAKPTGMAMNISTVPNSKPARLAIKVCPTEHMRTKSAPIISMETLMNAFHTDPEYITEAELVREQTRLFKKRVREKQQKAEAMESTRPTFPKDPPEHESRSYGPAAMSQKFNRSLK
ncbi:unnamed protein product [Cylicocyclus nassatus]|uniref:Uncharacterized protein n=1 Tax=Cylicocyclus nassatus TaxID=53992 RepID=A0AA36GPR7_CYLNA|nr:unnamed protein product [Cylicocyclus nassatus]